VTLRHIRMRPQSSLEIVLATLRTRDSWDPLRPAGLAARQEAGGAEARLRPGAPRKKARRVFNARWADDREMWLQVASDANRAIPRLFTTNFRPRRNVDPTSAVSTAGRPVFLEQQVRRPHPYDTHSCSLASYRVPVAMIVRCAVVAIQGLEASPPAERQAKHATTTSTSIERSASAAPPP